MDYSSIVKSRLLEYWENEVPKYVRRDIEVTHIKDMVTTIVGVRKCGKTFLTYQVVDELLKEEVIRSRRQVCYLHFDDEQLMGFSVENLHLIDRIFYSFFDSEFEDSSTAVFIFDEIHKIKGWENFVLRIKKKPGTVVIVTGSSADLEEDKVAKQLRGKTFTHHLYPLSFSEFLRFRGLDKVDPDRLSPKTEALCLHAFDEFLIRGAFPAASELELGHLPVLLKNYASSPEFVGKFEHI